MKKLKILFLSFCLLGIGTLIFFYFSEWLCPGFNGSHDLGKNIYMIEWDGGPIIVQGSCIRGRTCYGGSYVIPSYENRIKRKEHVTYSEYNDSWIFVKTVMCNPTEDKYYLINKGFKINTEPEMILKKYTKSFRDSVSAIRYMQRYN